MRAYFTRVPYPIVVKVLDRKPLHASFHFVRAPDCREKECENFRWLPRFCVDSMQLVSRRMCCTASTVVRKTKLKVLRSITNY
ncbi:hypothetical protein Q1695_000893 [Nippostrongylus brasiliensis]|nr:hypothetical protein Q1695_000893 [Nippostrongylus brasiliensis]